MLLNNTISASETEKVKISNQEINSLKNSDILFEENFEGSLSNWVEISGLWHLTTSDSYSPTHSMWFGDEITGNYDTGYQEFGSIISVPINLGGQVEAYLEFYEWREVEEDPGYDISSVYISTDGTNWQLIHQDYLNVDPWNYVSLDISAYCGYTSVQIRFYFDTVDDFLNDFTGWLIDDIQISTVVAPSEDNYEENDVYTQAYNLTSHENVWLHTVDGYGVQADNDWYEIYATDGETLFIDCDFSHALGNINIELYDSSGSTVVDGSYSTTDDEHIVYAVTTTGTYYIFVFYENAGNLYDLRWYTFSGVPADWTFLVYLDGDNNLESAGISDFLEMASVGSDTTISIVVQFDRTSGYSTLYGDWQTTKRFYITNGMTPTVDNALIDLGELNMGEQATLSDFISWGTSAFPADNYALILWNHGGGWKESNEQDPDVFKSVCWDDTSFGDCLTQIELKNALVSAGVHFDLIGFDACLMAMAEVDYQIKDWADVRVGSEESEPGDGWPYDTILADLISSPSMNANS
ncbi:MAG: clostripain-related cysteine peptidase, partial [Promethearchaeota archaeon]